METLIANIRKGKTALSKSISNYARMGIDIEILEIENNSVLVKATQKRIVNGYFLTKNQISNRVKEIFEVTEIPRKNIKVIALTHRLDVSIITPIWINDKMKEHDIKRKDILGYLHISESMLSQYLSGSRKMANPIKSAFYWMFLAYELNRDFREA